MVTTAGDDHDDERKPDYGFAVPQSQLRPLTAWYGKEHMARGLVEKQRAVLLFRCIVSLEH
jgi:hypothetical protein